MGGLLDPKGISLMTEQTSERRRATALRVVQEVGVADLLDQATKRLASTLDTSDTNVGMEAVQTGLNLRFLDAIADEWFADRERRL